MTGDHMATVETLSYLCWSSQIQYGAALGFFDTQDQVELIVGTATLLASDLAQPAGSMLRMVVMLHTHSSNVLR
jgi:hypothetical protein